MIDDGLENLVNTVGHIFKVTPRSIIDFTRLAYDSINGISEQMVGEYKVTCHFDFKNDLGQFTWKIDGKIVTKLRIENLIDTERMRVNK